jgi:Rad3-related DNA helicase
LNSLSENLKIFLKQSEESYIKTVQVNDKHGVSLEFTLLNPGDYLNEKLWNDIESVVLTSATLQIS